MNQPATNPRKQQNRKRNPLASQILTAIKRQGKIPLPSAALLGDDNRAIATKPIRVFGPYTSGSKWRLLLREGTQQQALPFDTREQAETAKAGMLSKLSAVHCKTIGGAVEEYLTHKRERGCQPRSVITCAEKLQFLPMEEMIPSLTRERAEKLYRAQAEKVSVATHQKNLRDARALFEFCVKQRYVGANPFKDIRPIGKAKAGKPQLRIDEAKKLVDLLMRYASQDDSDDGRSALALLVQLLMGLRSAEVLNLRKRDVDSDGTILVVEGTKSANARRPLKIAPVLRDLLALRCATMRPDSLIFAGEDRATPLPTDHLFKKLHKFCRVLGIPEVCPHSLRGLHGSLAVEAGATSAAVASMLGHGSAAVTLKHYITPSAADSARSSRVSAALLPREGDFGWSSGSSPAEAGEVGWGRSQAQRRRGSVLVPPSPRPPPVFTGGEDELIDALCKLSQAQLDRVLSAVGNRR